MIGKGIYNLGKDGKLKYIFKFLSSVNRHAYKDIYLLSNDVLSKNPFGSNFINNVVMCKKTEKISALMIFIKLLLYYIKSFYVFAKCILEKIIFIFKGNRYSFENMSNDLIIIDTFLLVHDVKKNKRFKDLFLLDFDLILESKKQNFVYLPVLINNKSIPDFQTLLNICDAQKDRILFEHQLLRLQDYIELFIFIIKYPIHVISFCCIVNTDNTIGKHLKNEMLKTLDMVTLQNFSRYLQGKQVAKIPCQKLKVISWYENQVIDKNFYKGLNDINSKIEIIGAKPYIFSNEMLNEIPDEFEKPFGSLPDKIVVNGKIQIPERTSLNYVIGPSFRYKKLFQAKIDFSSRSQALVLLTIYDYEIRNILQQISILNYPKSKIMVKFHPDTKKEDYIKFIPDGINVVDKSIYELFKISKIAIGISTGALIEAACMAIPSILIPHPDKFSLKFFPDLGKGILWDEVDQQNYLDELINKFDKIVENQKNELIELSEKYRSLYLQKPDEQEILSTYGIG